MCRSIKTLNTPGQTPTAEELNAAALQYVRKISGFRKPSQTNREAFELAVREIAESSRRLLQATKRSVRERVPIADSAPELPLEASAVAPNR